MRSAFLLSLLFSACCLIAAECRADPTPFTDKDAAQEILSAPRDPDQALKRIEKLRGDLATQKPDGKITLSGDEMQGGTWDGYFLQAEDVMTLAGEAFSAMDVGVEPGLCLNIEVNKCRDNTDDGTYGCSCQCFGLFVEICVTVCPYWNYRMPVQKVETNRSFRTAYYPDLMVALEQILNDNPINEMAMAAFVPNDIARAQKLGNVALKNAGKGGDGVSGAVADIAESEADDMSGGLYTTGMALLRSGAAGQTIQDTTSALDALRNKMGVEDSYKSRNVEMAPGGQAWSEYHVISELGHEIFRQALPGWRWHYEKKPKDPYIPYFSEGQGLLAGRISAFSTFGFPDQMALFDRSPLACLFTDVKRGRTAAALADKFGKGDAGDISTCLPMNNGPWIPVTARTPALYLASSAMLNFYKGTFAATNSKINFINASDFYSFNYKQEGDTQDDCIMWLHNDRMPGSCLHPNDGSGGNDYEAFERFPLDLSDASAMKAEEDPFFAAVEWRRFRTCPKHFITIGPEEWNE